MPTPIVVAHRGLHRSGPENSLAAFKAAASAKLPWAECDVWSSADGVPVVIHDPTLDRTSTGTGKVSNHTAKQLRQHNVPSFQEVLTALCNQTGIIVEIKPPQADALVAAVRLALQHFPSPWMIQSFHFENLDFTDRSAALVETPDQLQIAVDGKWKSVHADHAMIDQSLVDCLHKQGRKIGAWTVNKPAEIQRMIDLGIDVLITDEPELAAELISNGRVATQAGF